MPQKVEETPQKTLQNLAEHHIFVLLDVAEGNTLCEHPRSRCAPSSIVVCISADEDWALGYENVPSNFEEFASRPHMQSRLPPELFGAISRVQVLRPCWCNAS